MFNKKSFILTLALVLVLSMTITADAWWIFGGDDDKSDEAVTIRLGHITDTNHSWHKAAIKFAEEVDKRTNGSVKVEIYPNDQLGSERELIEGMRMNSIADMTITGETLGNWAPKASILGAMYLFRDEDHITKVVNGPVGEEIEKEILDKADIRVLSWFIRGSRHLTSNKPIRTPEDAEKLKMRVPNVPWFIKGWKKIGANPSPMAFSEVFTALQQGVMDAQENPLSLIKSAHFYEVQKYVNLTGHVRQWIYLAIGEKKYQSLTEDQKVALQEAAQVAHDYQLELFHQDTKELRNFLEEKGMTFVETDAKAFREKVENIVYEDYPELVDLYEKIKAVK